MTWLRSAAADALVEVLAGIDPVVSVFARPPETLNPPAYIVGYPRRVGYDEATFGVDSAELPVGIAVGPSEVDRVDDLAQAAKKALDVDPSLAGAVIHCRAGVQDSWRILNIAGADVLVVDLVLSIRM